MPGGQHEWQPLTVKAACELFVGLPIPWWVAGGMAIDLFVGRTTRAHGDLDIQILREHQLALQVHLRDWDLHKTNQPGLKRWVPGEYLEPGVNQVWCRRTRTAPWCMEIMLLDTLGDRWVYRRVPSIGGPTEGLGLKTSGGVPYLSPEIQLLFKAKREPMPKDDHDFGVACPLLSGSQQRWLRSALEVQFPAGHAWIPRLG
jgi:hypothetical protein